MKEAGVEEAANEQLKETETPIPEEVAKGQEEEELTKKTSEEPAEESLDDQPHDQDQDDQFFDTEMPSPPKDRSPTPERPPIPQGTPPKDPSPPHSESDREAEPSSSSSDQLPPPPPPKAKRPRMKKASLRTTKAFLRAKHIAGSSRTRRTPQQHDGDLQDQMKRMTTLVTQLSDKVQ